jgi:hypothetical protein
VSTRPHPRIARHAPASRHGTLSRFRLLAETVEAHRRASLERGGILSRDQALYERLAELERSLPIRSDAP